MTNPAATALRAIARQILAQADAIDGQGVTVTTDKPILIQWGDELVTTDEAEARGRAEIAERQKPHSWRDWSHDNPLPEDVGNNEKESPLWESAKPFWAQMERQVPFVFDDFGQRFNAVACLRRGGVADFERNVRRLWTGPDGDAYRAATENADIWPRIKV